ncbi:winged helix-turn-helix domain-containing protein [Alloacidobacterium dinghuense]|uniref:Winged helix-turn-helix domain-containing protein n=1 Tax=Alloacidobacterium dinghuense TaxID=2763107 RepID=A0A7G8BH73_9BACT|nr:AAA family ATPase [Alloacidobacterium dinghuense]QNI31893.1 winged helix-turn-helix domain-containing protein [Alloacidobacterium dinghuense]
MKRFGCFQLDAANECLWCDGKQVPLAPKPFAVLRYLVENPKRLVTHDELLDALWPETFVQPQVLRTYVLELRKLLGDDPDEPQYIQTVPKRGYRFVAKVTAIKQQAPESSGSVQRIVGRDSELARLDVDLEHATNGNRKLIFLTGDAGCGKTALIDAFCARACSDDGARMVRGQSVEGFGGKEPFYPVREALSQLNENEKTSEFLSRKLPGWFGKNAENGAKIPALGEICEVVETLAQGEPLLLVLEDLHWADASTLDLLSALARRRGSQQLMILASYRPAEIDGQHPLPGLKEDLSTRRLCCEIVLGPLNRKAVSDYLQQQLNSNSLPGGLASFVHQHSEGNPLFMTATFEHLQSQSLLLSKAGKWHFAIPLSEIELGIPDGLLGMIDLQLGRLNDRERRLLEAGSIVGAIFPAWTAAAALKEDVLDLEDEYASLARRTRLLNAAGQDELPDGTRSTFYVFAHGLFREALYTRQPAARRAERHRRVAERLKSLFAGSEASIALELAQHYEAAGSWKEAIEALRLAADTAATRDADNAAHELLKRALDLSENLRPDERKSVERNLISQMKKFSEYQPARLA